MSMITNDWDEKLKPEYKKDYYRVLYQKVNEEYASGKKIFPPADDIFNAFHLTPLKDVKCVIIGQDPYHNDGQAHGLCFSVKPDVEIPPSLVNIYKELEDDLGCYIPNNGYLVKWAKQGVLLLNSVLTVRAHQANSHQGIGWEQFTDAVMDILNKEDRPIVFLLWGKPAQNKAAKLNNPNHLILKAPHPSPLSAYRGFFGCKHFSQANAFLEEHGLTPIDWQIENIEGV
ncbi:MAG: uracil-DNA glycosylase [Lachnospiraceae bacterium]